MKRIILLSALLVVACGTPPACVSWNAIDEDVYVTEWQREHCTRIELRTIPRGDYNP